MNKDKQDKLKADFPQIFVDLYDCTPQESGMAWGIECGDGWYRLLWELCVDIMALDLPEDFKATQVKNKRGGLRFYVAGSNVEINKLIFVAEEKSFKICDECGSLPDECGCK